MESCLFFLYGCKSLVFLIKGRIWVRMFKNRFMENISEHERGQVTEEWSTMNMRSVVIFVPHQIFFRRSNQGECDGWGVFHV